MRWNKELLATFSCKDDRDYTIKVLLASNVFDRTYLCRLFSISDLEATDISAVEYPIELAHKDTSLSPERAAEMARRIMSTEEGQSELRKTVMEIAGNKLFLQGGSNCFTGLVREKMGCSPWTNEMRQIFREEGCYIGNKPWLILKCVLGVDPKSHLEKYLSSGSVYSLYDYVLMVNKILADKGLSLTLSFGSIHGLARALKADTTGAKGLNRRPIRSVVCKQCGKEFTTSHISQKFCSKECCLRNNSAVRLVQGWRKADKIKVKCKQCGKCFLTRMKKQIFCSRECSRQWRRILNQNRYSKFRKALAQFLPKRAARGKDIRNRKSNQEILEILEDWSKVKAKKAADKTIRAEFLGCPVYGEGCALNEKVAPCSGCPTLGNCLRRYRKLRMLLKKHGIEMV